MYRPLRLVSRLAMTATAAFLIATTPAIAADDAEPATAAQIEWDLTDLYADVDAWNADRERLAGIIPALAAYKGHLGESAATLATALDAVTTAQREIYRMFVYAFLEADEDARISETQERRTLANRVLSEYSEAVSYLNPEILSIGAETIEAFISQSGALDKHAFGLRDTLRQAPHTLSVESERVMAATGPALQGAERIYSMLTRSDLPFPTITLSTGDEVRLDQAAYSRYRAEPDRADRKHVFDAFWGSWKDYETTIGQMLDTHVQSHIFRAKARGYDNALAAALSGSNIPTAVYYKLIEATNRHLPSLHRYFKLRQRILGLEDLHYYDIYPTLVTSDREFSIKDAKQLTLASAAPLGDHYLDLLRQGFSGNWMHVFPQQGKRSGAYMMGVAYDVHPYLLLNFNSTFEDVSTFTHEWGYAVHTMLSKENNPWETAPYATFTAELASTSNEVLLQEYMLKQDITDDERLYYLGAALEGIRGTFFRQTMFAEFELRIHEMVEAGEALSGKRMSEVYEALLRKYHGSDDGVLAIDPAYAIEWAYIPHFYRNFYVFQYATSISGGTMFAERMFKGDTKATASYLSVLAAGGSQYAYEMLRDAGIDLATDAPYDTLVARMNRMMDEIEAILDSRE